MEQVIDSEFIYKILVIKEIVEIDRVFIILFETETEEGNASGEFYKITFNSPFEIRYSVEDMNRTRFSKLTAENELQSSINIIKNSPYIKILDEYFVDTYPVNELIHYLITDSSDSVIDILTNEIPNIEMVADSSLMLDTKKKLDNLVWWNESENLKAIQAELDELRAYKEKRENEDKKSREDEILANSFGF